MSDDESVIEEEYLIYAELCDNADPNIFKHAESSFCSFALDSNQPLLIIGGQAFVGTYRDTVGTAVFLEETSSGSEQIGIGNEPSDTLFVTSPAKRLEYVAHTRKTLEMSRVLLLEKNKQHEESKDQEEYLEEDSVELDNNVPNEGLEGYQEHNKETKERPVEVKNLEQPDVVSTETDKILLKADNLPFMMSEGHIIENIEQMKITNNVNATVM